MSTNKADTVLVVDDAEPNRLFLEAHLKAAGYQVLEATDGDEAISVLVDYQDAVDVVLLDRRMPRVDGMDVLAWIKKQAPPHRQRQARQGNQPAGGQPPVHR